MVVTDEELQQAEETILLILSRASSPYAPNQLMNELSQRGISEYSARAAIWYLIDRDEVTLTRDRKLEPTMVGHGQRA
ncbi:MAG: hypothetical protein ACRDJH_17220 [Thermomicrobiales bacterium]